MRPLPIDFAEYRRLRRRARVLTLACAVVAAPLTYRTVLALGAEGEARRPGLIAFVALGALAYTAWRVVVPAWRRSWASRPTVLALDPTPGQIYGIPELDEPPRRHRGLTGEDEPPTRW